MSLVARPSRKQHHAHATAQACSLQAALNIVYTTSRRRAAPICPRQSAQHKQLSDLQALNSRQLYRRRKRRNQLCGWRSWHRGGRLRFALSSWLCLPISLAHCCPFTPSWNRDSRGWCSWSNRRFSFQDVQQHATIRCAAYAAAASICQQGTASGL